MSKLEVVNFLVSHQLSILISFLLGVLVLYVIPTVIQGIKTLKTIDEIREEFEEEIGKISIKYSMNGTDAEEATEKIIFMGQLYTQMLQDIQDDYLRIDKRSSVKYHG